MYSFDVGTFVENVLLMTKKQKSKNIIKFRKELAICFIKKKKTFLELEEGNNNKNIVILFFREMQKCFCR